MTKTIVLVLCLTLLASPAPARCRWSIDEANEVETRLIPVATLFFHSLGVRLGFEEDGYYLLATFNTMGKRADFDAETPFVLALDDGPLSLTPAEATGMRRTFLGVAVNNKRSDVLYSLSAEGMARLAASIATGLSLHFRENDGPAERVFEIQPRAARNLAEAANCVLAERRSRDDNPFSGR